MTPNPTLTSLHAKEPLVHCITNYVAVSLAASASPAMIHAPEEVSDFAPITGAFTIKIGSLQAELFARCDETKVRNQNVL
ncbi:hypothetical protein GCM10007385_00180 [Tateyamaria omphalii]|uniref:hydroxyethylthiazole kinase n=1 Tax=Tateyamaria omphalii TaxID=299262 RepID=UPI0016735E57|nr:hydroxyethylthiazole kinase [Tateyamaria omphalii]GGX37571.1 hypothetical protein GCM10007385_00180 [Tateyamaria omphalii]